jgi:hypothetical protein
VISPDKLETTVAADRTVRLGFATGRETSEAAKGDERFGAAFASLALSRKEFGDFMRLVHDQVTSARNLLLGQVPAPLRPLVDLALAQTLDPIVAQLEQEIGGLAAPIFRLNGSGTVYVRYHTPPSTTTVPPTVPPSPPPSDEPDDFCEGFRVFVSSHPDAATVPGAGIAASERLSELRPLAPAELVPDVDAGVAFFAGADRSAGTDPVTLANLLQAWAPATGRLLGYCGITG